MRFGFAATLAALVVAILGPAAEAQSVGQRLGATDRCVKNCDPKDVNTVVPQTGDVPVGVILYAHMEDILQMAPLNTQKPDAKHEPDRVVDLGPCLDTRTGTPTDLHIGSCDFPFFSSPGLVEYLQDGWRTHQEPGLAYNASIASTEMVAYVTLRAAAAAPNVGIYARLETGRHAFRGQLIAESSPGAADATRTLVSVPGDAFQSWEYTVVMPVKENVIPEDAESAGFVLTLRVFQLDNALATARQPGVGIHTGAKFPLRIAFQLNTPLRTDSAGLIGQKGSMFIRWGFESVWGNYDIQDQTVALRSTGPTRLPDEWIQHVILKRSVDHDGHFKPINSTWRVDYAQHKLADGDYQLTGSALNLQGTYLLRHDLAFHVRGGVPEIVGADFAGQAVPSPPLGLLLLAAGLAGAFVRRRP